VTTNSGPHEEALQRGAPPAAIGTEHRKLVGSGIAVSFGLDVDVELPVRHRGRCGWPAHQHSPDRPTRTAERGHCHPSIRTWSPVDRSRGGHERASKKDGQKLPAQGSDPTPARSAHPASGVSVRTHFRIRPGMESGSRTSDFGEGHDGFAVEAPVAVGSPREVVEDAQRVERSARRSTRVGFDGVALPLGSRRHHPTRRGPPQPRDGTGRDPSAPTTYRIAPGYARSTPATAARR